MRSIMFREVYMCLEYCTVVRKQSFRSLRKSMKNDPERNTQSRCRRRASPTQPLDSGRLSKGDPM